MPASPSWTETDYPNGSPVAYVASGGSGGSPYQKTLITNTTATPCLGPLGLAAQYIVGLVNNALAAQSVNVTLYDNPSAASGTPLVVAPLGAGQIVTFPAPGIPVLSGCTAQSSGIPTLPGILVLCR